MSEEKEGWGWPLGFGQAAHYFRNWRAICNPRLEQHGIIMPQLLEYACKHCKAKLAKEKASG